jgi:hypothetical protein
MRRLACGAAPPPGRIALTQRASRPPLPPPRARQAWTRPANEVPFDPLLLLCAEGLRETVHPHTFVARTAFMELLLTEDAYTKARPTAALRAYLASGCPSAHALLAAQASQARARAAGVLLADAPRRWAGCTRRWCRCCSG